MNQEKLSMFETVTLQEAQTHLADLVAQLQTGKEFVITQDERPVARIIGTPVIPRQPRQPGSAKGKLIILAEDDDHLADFQEYLPS
jgi:antitoxin (DNA-binding transcriptional repressor) of toxin-antitoxin stability system